MHKTFFGVHLFSCSSFLYKRQVYSRYREPVKQATLSLRLPAPAALVKLEIYRVRTTGGVKGISKMWFSLYQQYNGLQIISNSLNSLSFQLCGWPLPLKADWTKEPMLFIQLIKLFDELGCSTQAWAEESFTRQRNSLYSKFITVSRM